MSKRKKEISRQIIRNLLHEVYDFDTDNIREIERDIERRKMKDAGTVQKRK